MLPPGHRIKDTYEIVKLAGQGGMAIVYQVRHLNDGTLYALKVFVHSSTKLASYFEDEARLMRELGTPHIPAVVDIGKFEGHPFIVMEWLDGETLEDRLARENVLQLDAVVEICRQIGTVLALTHQRQIVHRDMKPGNIFLCRHMPRGADPKGLPYFVKVLDFGIARNSSTQRPRTVQGTIMGTPDYMAPEQASGERSARIDSRTDQYGLAMIAYVMLSGRPAFTARSDAPVDVAGQMEAILKDPPPPLPPRVPVAVEAVLQRALSKSPDDRFPSVEQFVAALVTAQKVGATAHTMRSRTDVVPVALLEPQTVPPPLVPQASVAVKKPPMSVLIEGRYAVKGVDAALASKLAASSSDPSGEPVAPWPRPLVEILSVAAKDTRPRTEDLSVPPGPLTPLPRRWLRWWVVSAFMATTALVIGIKACQSENTKVLDNASIRLDARTTTDASRAAADRATPTDPALPPDLRTPEDLRTQSDLSVQAAAPSCPPLFTSRCVRGKKLTHERRQLIADRLNHYRLRVCSRSMLVLVPEENWLRSDGPLPSGVSPEQVSELLTDLHGYWRARRYSPTELPEKIEVGCQ